MSRRESVNYGDYFTFTQPTAGFYRFGPCSSPTVDGSHASVDVSDADKLAYHSEFNGAYALLARRYLRDMLLSQEVKLSQDELGFWAPCLSMREAGSFKGHDIPWPPDLDTCRTTAEITVTRDDAEDIREINELAIMLQVKPGGSFSGLQALALLTHGRTSIRLGVVHIPTTDAPDRFFDAVRTAPRRYHTNASPGIFYWRYVIMF
jgi:hypothetical protein